jgi:hypothetical protein
MSYKSVRHAAISSLSAVLLSVLSTGPVAAATWATPVIVDRGSQFDGPAYAELVSLPGSRAVVGYGLGNGADIASVVVRRTSTGGATWSDTTLVTDHGWGPSTAGRGSSVDVVWLWNGRVLYAHSDDLGKTFGEHLALSRAGEHANRARVARGPGGVVAVTWDQRGVVKARVSTNAGTSFSPATTVATRGFFPRVAVGDGVVYVLYSHGDYDTIRVARSVDDGATWGRRTNFGRYGSTSYSITAEGSDAFVAYETSNADTFWAVRYRATSDRGTTWSAARDLLPDSWSGYNGQLSLRAGVLRATFVRCHDSFDVCSDTGRIFYRQTSDGVHWTGAQRVSPKSLYAESLGVGFSGTPIVLYLAYATEHYIPVLFSRARQ